MKKLNLLITVAILICSTLSAQNFKPDASYYSVDFWTPDTLGNHRVVLSVDSESDIIVADPPWRKRNDSDRRFHW